MITPSNEFWKVFKATNGALSCCEALAIIQLVTKIPTGNMENKIIEYGTYEGKSALAASYAISAILLYSTDFYLVDPIFGTDEKKDNELINKIDSISRGLIIPKLISDFSTNVITENKSYAYVMVDSGSHQDGLPMQEVKLLEDRMVQGGIIAFHDWKSQFREVKEASDYLVSTGKYEYIPINWDEIIQYVNENNLEDGNLSWHHNELKNPCFLGALKRK